VSEAEKLKEGELLEYQVFWSGWVEEETEGAAGAVASI